MAGPKRQPVAEAVAAELVEWLERSAKRVADDLLDSALAPQVVQLPEKQMRAFYRTNPRIQQLLWNPDGSENGPGRTQLMAELGPDGYESMALAQLPEEGE